MELIDRLEREPEETLKEIYQRIEVGLIDHKTSEGKELCLEVIGYLRRNKMQDSLKDLYHHLALQDDSNFVLEKIILGIGSSALIMGFCGNLAKKFREDVKNYFNKRRICNLKRYFGTRS